jgi:uncharacterized protein YukE
MVPGAECFGNPPTVQSLADALKQTATALNQLCDESKREVDRLHPMWTGNAAEAFRRHMAVQLAAGRKAAGIARAQSDTMQTLTWDLARALALFHQTELKVYANQFFFSAELQVVTLSEDPTALARRNELQAEVDQEKAMAEEARGKAVTALQAVGHPDVDLFEFLSVFVPFGKAGPNPGKTLPNPGKTLPNPGKTLPRPGVKATPEPAPRPAGAAVTEDTPTGWAHSQGEMEANYQKQVQTNQMWKEAEQLRTPSAEYRAALSEMHGPPPRDGLTYDAHHQFPVEYGQKFQKMGIDPNNPAYGTWVSREDHWGLSSQYSKDWESFFQNNPNATRTDAYQFANELANKYGYQSNVPAIPPGPATPVAPWPSNGPPPDQ